MNLIELGALASATIALITVLSKLISIVTQTHDTVKEIKNLSTKTEEHTQAILLLKEAIKDLSNRVTNIESFISEEYKEGKVYQYGA